MKTVCEQVQDLIDTNFLEQIVTEIKTQFSPETLVAQMHELPDDVFVEETKRRCIVFDVTDATDDALIAEVNRRIGDGKISIKKVLSMIDTFEFDEETCNTLEDICRNNDIHLDNDLDAKHPIVECAARLAFANPFEVQRLLNELRECFKAANCTSLQVFNQTEFL